MEPDPGTLGTAMDDFRRARNRADLKDMLGRLRGESTQLLSFDEARRKLKLRGFLERGLQEVPLDAIVGSVGRYTDFTRDFLPRQEINPERWARVKIAASGLIGLPPIEAYQIGEAYFVKDGNHRVSVARRLGATHIQAYVTEVQTRVSLSLDDQPDDLIIKGEYANFLEWTNLDKLRPGADLRVTIPGQYQVLTEHIDVHRFFMGIDLQREIPFQEAVAHWYDHIYLPVVEVIRAQGILREFPDRTEADLYLWIAEHRAQMEERLGWEIKTEHIASHLADHHSPAKEGVFSRLSETLFEVIVPHRLEGGPPTGEWRTKTLTSRPSDRLLIDMLVPVNGREDGWCALEQALVVAGREGTRVHGLFVVPSEEGKESQASLGIQAEFNRRCEAASVEGDMVIAAGQVVDQICQRAGLTDLVVVNLSYPPGSQPLARLSSGFRDLIQRCPRPVLATPQTVSPLNKALLAYDGSPKAQEALFVTTYLGGKWNIPLVVLSVIDDGMVTEDTLVHAQAYLEKHCVEATYLPKSGPAPQAILEAIKSQGCNLVIMGGYGHGPVLEVMLGSTVDQVLRESEVPSLICR